MIFQRKFYILKLEVMKLKVKIVSSKEQYNKIENKLKQAGFIISDDADFVFKELDYLQDTFIGLLDDEYVLVPYQKILYVEAFDHDVFLKTIDQTYKIKEKLYEVESILQEVGFIRINKSQVVNKQMIKSIIPSLNSRMNIVMKNKELLYISRVYLPNFKNVIGFK